MEPTLLGEISEIAVIARGISVRVRRRLNQVYGQARWRKLKGVARVLLAERFAVRAELQWYEAHGFGRREIKIKRLLEPDDE